MTSLSLPRSGWKLTPDAPRTPHRTFRIDDELYRAAKERAAENGETLTDVVRRALTEYVAE